MSTDFTDSDEETVSDGTTMPEQPCTDNLPNPLNQQASSKSASSATSSSRKTTTVFEQVRIGQLNLTVDDLDFAYAMQCGILFGQRHYRQSTTSMRHVLERFLERLDDEQDENGHIEDYTQLVGEMFGEISYLLTGIKRLHVDFNPYGPEREVP